MLFTRSDVKVYIFVMVPPKKFNVKPIFFKTDFIFTIPLKQADLGKKKSRHCRDLVRNECGPIYFITAVRGTSADDVPTRRTYPPRDRVH